jgi:protein-disulfide isomerase
MSEALKPSTLQRLTSVLFLLVAILGIAVGLLWKKIDNFEKGGGGAVAKTENVLSVENIKKYAKDLKLNTKKFNACLDNGDFAQRVGDETAEGSAFGVTGTPGFFVGNAFLAGAYPYEWFQKIIDFQLNGGDWKKPTDVKALVDKDETNGEIIILDKVPEIGVAPVLGNQDAKLTIIEYSDFECPYCARFHKDTWPQLKENYIDSGKVKFSYKQYPLTFHANAQKLAEASLCANDQGKFWEMYAKLFDASSIAAAK